MDRFNIRQKLGISFAIMICLMLLQGYASLEAMRMLGRSFDSSTRKAGESSALIRETLAGVAGMNAYTRKTQFACALNGMLDPKAAGACLSCHPLPNADESRREFAAISAVVHSKLQALAATGLSADEKQPLDRVDQSAKEWRDVFGEFLGKATAHQFDAGHSIITGRMEPIRESMEKATKEIEAVEAHSLARSQAESAAVVQQRVVLLFGFQFAVLLPTIFFFWRFLRRLSAQLRALCEAARSMAAGDVENALSVLTAVGL
jgi:CHASE3 domain sensor protein